MNWKIYAWIKRGKRRKEILHLLANSNTPLTIKDIKSKQKIAMPNNIKEAQKNHFLASGFERNDLMNMNNFLITLCMNYLPKWLGRLPHPQSRTLFCTKIRPTLAHYLQRMLYKRYFQLLENDKLAVILEVRLSMNSYKTKILSDHQTDKPCQEHPILPQVLFPEFRSKYPLAFCSLQSWHNQTSSKRRR